MIPQTAAIVFAILLISFPCWLRRFVFVKGFVGVECAVSLLEAILYGKAGNHVKCVMCSILQYFCVVFYGPKVCYTVCMKKNIVGKKPKVLVAISLLHASGRDMLSGILNYLAVNASWTLTLVQTDDSPFSADRVHRAQRDGIAGFIVTDIPDAGVEKALLESKLPIVLTCVRSRALESRHDRISFVRNDNAGIGAMGADYFLRRGRFGSFAFVPAPSRGEWSILRQKAFVSRLSSAGIAAQCYAHKGSVNADIKKLSEWIGELPKPVALMAACDWRAVQVLSACEMAGLDVPRQVSVLGVDNDEFVCSCTTPQLSSILPGHEAMGWRAAEEIGRMLAASRERDAPSFFTVKPERVVERSSTTPVVPAVALIERAMQFMQKNASRGISANDVVRHLRVSRRLVELRFREMKGVTLRQALENIRIGRLKRMLSTSERSIAECAASCGFRNPNVLAHLFKKKFGVSMREFRHRSSQAETK